MRHGPMPCPRCDAESSIELTISHGLRCYMCGATFSPAELEELDLQRQLLRESFDADDDDTMPADGPVGRSESGCGG